VRAFKGSRSVSGKAEPAVAKADGETYAFGMIVRQLGIFLTLAVTLVWAPGARAEPVERGFSIEGHVGLNNLTEDDYVDSSRGLPLGLDIDPLIGLGVTGLARVHRHVSAGISVGYGFLFAHDKDLEDERAGFLSILAVARGHYALDRFEPWVELGMGYAMTHARADLRGANGDFSVMLHGVAVEMATGISIFLTDRLYVSPFFKIVFGIWPGGCYDVSAGPFEGDECGDTEDLFDDREPDLPHLWTMGATLGYVL